MMKVLSKTRATELFLLVLAGTNPSTAFHRPLLLFPSEPFLPKAVDPDYLVEYEAARMAGFQTALIDHAVLEEGNTKGAIARVPRDSGPALLRGWMVTVEQYEALEKKLSARGVQLTTTTQQYRFCHHLPENYPVLQGQTPESVWTEPSGSLIPTFSDDEILACIQQLGKSGPAIVKDFVKSEKHNWETACFIPDISKTQDVLRVARRFLELRGQYFTGGLVFGKYVPLEIVARHPQSNMPLASEFRIFWAAGEPLLVHRYWADLVDLEYQPPTEQFRKMAQKIDSPFFTMDIAKQDNGTWTIVELGDGQVAGLPDRSLATTFYKNLAQAMTTTTTPYQEGNQKREDCDA